MMNFNLMNLFEKYPIIIMIIAGVIVLLIISFILKRVFSRGSTTTPVDDFKEMFEHEKNRWFHGK